MKWRHTQVVVLDREADNEVSSPPLEARDGRLALPWFAIGSSGAHEVEVYALDRNLFDFLRSVEASGQNAFGFGSLAGDTSKARFSISTAELAFSARLPWVASVSSSCRKIEAGKPTVERPCGTVVLTTTRNAPIFWTRKSTRHDRITANRVATCPFAQLIPLTRSATRPFRAPSMRSSLKRCPGRIPARSPSCPFCGARYWKRAPELAWKRFGSWPETGRTALFSWCAIRARNSRKGSGRSRPVSTRSCWM